MVGGQRGEGVVIPSVQRGIYQPGIERLCKPGDFKWADGIRSLRHGIYQGNTEDTERSVVNLFAMTVTTTPSCPLVLCGEAVCEIFSWDRFLLSWYIRPTAV